MAELGGANRDILKRQLQILRKAPNQRSPEDLRTFAGSIKAKFFQDLGEHEKMQVCQYLKLEGAPKDSTIFKQGDRGDKFYLILCGSVGRVVSKKKGRIQWQLGQDATQMPSRIRAYLCVHFQ